MEQTHWLALALAGTMTLTACGNLPRSAGIQTEIIGSGGDRADPGTLLPGGITLTQDFAVAPVARATLPVLTAWPLPGQTALSWIDHGDQPATRTIAPGDTLTITVWTNEDNSLLTSQGQRFVTLPAVRVSSSGTVFLPYIGTVRVGGMAPETAREQIEAGYTEVSPTAQVQVEQAEGRLNTVSLVSGVAAPGSYPLIDSGFSVTALLAQGGGVAANLRNPQIRLQRGDQLYGISLDRLLAEPRLDTALRGGDRVYVEADDHSFLSLGAAGSQAVHEFTSEDMSALEAIAAIGGVSESRANPQGLLLLRRYPGSVVGRDSHSPPHERMIFTLDLTSADGLFSAGEFRIAPGDLIYVTESPVTGVRTVFGLIGSVIGLNNQLTN